MLPVVSYPKSGRTWLRYACHVAGVPEPEFTHANHETSPPDVLGFGFKGIPPEMVGKPAIFLHRNPADTAVSYFMQLRHKDLVPGRKTHKRLANIDRSRVPPFHLDPMVKDPRYGIEPILKFNRAWLDMLAGVEGAHIFTYEEFKADPHTAFSRFFHVALDQPQVDIDAVVDGTTFEKMRALQADKDEGHKYRLVQPFDHEPESAKVRKGEVRGYRNYMQPDTIKFCRRLATTYGFTI